MASEASPTNDATGGRFPCVPVAAALVAGIAAGHEWEVPRAGPYAVAAVAGAILSSGGRVRPAVRVGALLGLYVAVGAALHQASWRDRAADSVVRIAGDEPRLVRLTGTLAAAPVEDRRRDAGRRAAWLLEDRSRVAVEAASVARDDGPPLPVSGRVQVAAAGHLSHVGPGDRVEVTGWLVRPSGPRNPGGFDAATYLRSRGIDAVIYADHPDAVRRVAVGGPTWRRLAAELRERLAVQFTRHLSTANGPVGAAMILGDRSAMPVDIRDAYVASGAMHILAISGMNVGILAMFLGCVGRLLNFSPASVMGGVVAVAWAYAALTNLEPPVVRAAVFLSLWALASLTLRKASLLNTAAATVIVLLSIDPLLLFDVGAQLSFLAVLGMSWSFRVLPEARTFFREAAEDRPWLAWGGRVLLETQMLSLGIWLFTAPLIAATFQIVSPVGLLLNVLLVPVATGVMGAGYVFFAACLATPWAAGLFGWFFDAGLSAVNVLVVAAGEWDLGHMGTPAPPAWWTAGFYALLLLSLVRPRWAGRRVRAVGALLLWCAAGLVPAVAGPAAGDGFRMTVLDVGHGGAILVETPGGRRLLFDCGSIADDRQAADAVWRAVRERGGTGIDLFVASHADLDHCNNVPALLRGGPVGGIAVARTFLDFDQEVVRSVCDAARESGTAVRLVAAGDEIGLDPEASIAVLHPRDQAPGDDDNANSIVLRVSYAGRSVLLTGDLEGPGQWELFGREPAAGHDVVVAPHHGGTLANTAEFAAWARPRAVVVSSGARVNAAMLAETYPEADLYLTPRDGAVTFEITGDGRVSAETRTGGR